MAFVDALVISKDVEELKKCATSFVLAINETMNVLNGKWKIPVIAALLFGKKRFSELEKSIPKITSRMLSKELRDLEVNGIVVRKVYDTLPVTVEYELTESGRSFTTVLDVMLDWGLAHRKKSLKRKS